MNTQIRSTVILITTMTLMALGLSSCEKSEDNRNCQPTGVWQDGNGTECTSQIKLYLYEDHTGLLLKHCSVLCTNPDYVNTGWASHTDLTYQVVNDTVTMLLGARNYCSELDTLNTELVGIISCDSFYMRLNGRFLEYH
jgi:hypothetical protein